MNTFEERFKDRIDLTDGSVVLRKEEYDAIVAEAQKALRDRYKPYIVASLIYLIEDVCRERDLCAEAYGEDHPETKEWDKAIQEFRAVLTKKKQ